MISWCDYPMIVYHMHISKLWRSGFILLWFVMSLGIVKADKQAGPSPWVTTSADRRHLFKMTPIEPENRIYQGICYTIDRQGEFNEIWKTSPWYCDAGHLGPSGRYFVRWGPWARDSKELSDLAIAFYDKGELLKEYKVADLLQHPEAIHRTVSHYSWRAFEMTTPNEIIDSTFHLTMIDGTTYLFDLKTAEILKKGHDANASDPNSRKYRDDKKTKQLFIEADEFSSWFTRLFDVELPNLTAVIGSQNHETPIPLEFHFEPKEQLLGPAVIEGTWKNATESIQPILKPEGYLNALKTAFAHPDVIKERQLSQAVRLRLKTRTTYPHQDLVSLEKLFREIYKKELPNEDLSQWVEFDFIPIEPRPSFFLNRVTGKILSQND